MPDTPQGLTDDLTVRQQAAQALARLFDSLYEGAIVVDAEARIVWMNDKYKALIGWNGVQPIEGHPVEEIIPNSRMRDVVESGKADLLDIFAVNDRQMVVSRIPLSDEAGEITGALGVILYDRVNALRPIVSKFQRLQSDLASAQRELADRRRARYRFSDFVGASKVVRDLKAKARRAAAGEATVLLLGETGTGKELLAHAIHAASPRAEKPMVRVNAAAIPENLLEAELFGVAPGAYTGADPKGRAGKIQLAEGGSLFLDEVGDMPLPLQVKLLRVLQEREIEPLGSNKVIPVDVRVIAATSRDLEVMVAQGRFRADLYYRLHVVPLTIPPLRQRQEDLAALCHALLERLAHESGDELRGIDQGALDLLIRYSWPGNVRELANVLQQAVNLDDAHDLGRRHIARVLPETELLKPETVTAPILGEANLEMARQGEVRKLREVQAEVEREMLQRALAASGGVKVKAAKLLGISRAQFYEKLAAHGEMSG